MSLAQDLTHDGYVHLLKKTAITHDSKVRVQPSRVPRRVCEHNLEYYHHPDTGEMLDIDSSIETILANKTVNNYKPNKPTNPNNLMSKEACLKLSPLCR